MQGEVKAEVCVADGGGGHGEDAEPEPGVRPHLVLPSPPVSFSSVLPLLHLNHLARVEESRWEGVQEDRRVDCEGASLSPVLKEESHPSWEEKTSQCVSRQAPPVSQTPPRPREPLVDLQHPGDVSEAAPSTQGTSEAKVEEGKGRTGSEKETFGCNLKKFEDGMEEGHIPTEAMRPPSKAIHLGGKNLGRRATGAERQAKRV